jgi:Flp pilus assembly pilin Flp
MMNKLTELYVKLTTPVKNERGAQSLEWLGLAALLILVLGIVSTAVSDSKGSITTIISNIFQKITDMVG